MDSISFLDSEYLGKDFFEHRVKTRLDEWSTRDERLKGVPEKKKSRLSGRLSSSYWAGRVKDKARPRAVERVRAGQPSLSNVPKLADSDAQAKIELIERLFCASKKPIWEAEVTIRQMRGRTKVSVESKRLRLERVDRKDKRASKSRSSLKVVNRETGEPMSLPGYWTLVDMRSKGTVVPDLSLYELVETGKRGVIKGFSDRSRWRLKETSTELDAMGVRAKFMLTLTYPGDWLSVASSGDQVKRHIDVYRKRLTSYFERLGMRFSLLWFIEFQKRGAPHWHGIMFGDELNLTREQIAQAQKDLRQAWAEVVGHSDLREYEKHRRRGVGFSPMRKGHFGYAGKYADKMAQKTVPENFRNVGRFWGLWNFKMPKIEPLCMTLNLEQLNQLHDALQIALLKTSDKTWDFANRMRKILLPKVKSGFEGITHIGEVTGSCTVFGEKAVQAVWDWIGAGFRFERSSIAWA